MKKRSQILNEAKFADKFKFKEELEKQRGF